MSRHKLLPKSVRLQVYDKCGGHCAYCGCEIKYKEMQVDHINSVYVNELHKTMTDEELNSLENLMPACRKCNFYKSTFPLETFRQRLSTVLMNNLRKEIRFKIAVSYGLVEEHPHEIKFYYEELEEKNHE